MLLLSILFLCGLAASQAVWRAIDARHVRHTVPATFPPAGWLARGPVPHDYPVGVTFVLHHNASGMAALRTFVDIESDPRTATGAPWKTKAEIGALVSPGAAASLPLRRFLTSRASPSMLRLSDFADALDVVLPAGEWARAFGLRFTSFVHSASGREVHRTRDALVLPADAAAPVQFALGLHELFEHPHERRARIRQASSPAVPYVAAINGGADNLLVKVANPLGAQATGVTVIVTDLQRGTAQSVALSGAQCAGGQCSAAFFLDAWARVNITLATNLSNGTQLAYAYPTFYALTPWVTPAVLFDTYGVPRATRGTHPANLQSVASFESQFVSFADLRSFEQLMGLLPANVTIVGPNDESQPGGESTLDLQYISGVGQGIPTIVWSVAGPDGKLKYGQYILTWALQVAQAPDGAFPWVTSISYGDAEAAFAEYTGHADYIPRMEAQLVMLCARGMTVFAGSGDAGATNIGEMGNDLSPPVTSCDAVTPFYPSSSQYVVSMSASFLTPNYLPVCYQKIDGLYVSCDQNAPREVIVSIDAGVPWTTGGGFSSMFPRQSFQQPAVERYMQVASMPPSDFYNASNAAYADLSVLGHEFIFVFNGSPERVGGTSASGPACAGLFALINDVRLQIGLRTMGRINPQLYFIAGVAPEAFNDILVGTNNGGDVQAPGSAYPTSCPDGFPAAPAYDVPSGLGSPNWPVLLDFFTSGYYKN